MADWGRVEVEIPARIFLDPRQIQDWIWVWVNWGGSLIQTLASDLARIDLETPQIQEWIWVCVNWGESLIQTLASDLAQRLMEVYWAIQ